MFAMSGDAVLSPSPLSQFTKGVFGVGLGLRWDFIDELLATPASNLTSNLASHQGRPELRDGAELALDFVEISPENYIGRGGYYDEALDRVAARWPIVTHGLTMSLGGTDPLRDDYLRDLALFLERVRSPWHSEHLCFSTFGGVVLHDLFPVPFKQSEVFRIAERIKRAQDSIRRPLAIENVSFYLHPGKPEMGEAEFLSRVCDAADCGLLLDVNNAYVNATNFGFDIDQWLREAPLDRVVQIHVAGHDWFTEGDWKLAEAPMDGVSRRDGKLIVDTHGATCCDAVLAVLERALEKTGPVPVLLERDQAIPALAELLFEVAKVKRIWERARSKSEDR